MMSEKKTTKPLSDQEKQMQAMPGEVDPKNVKAEVFMAIQRAKGKLKVKK